MVKEREKKVQLGITLEKTAYDKLKVLASRDSRSFNNFVNLILGQYLDALDLSGRFGSRPGSE